GEARQPVIVIVGLAIFDLDVLAVDVAGLRQPAMKCSSPALVQCAHLSAGEKADDRCLLLCFEWLRARQCPDQKDETNKSVTIHSMVSSHWRTPESAFPTIGPAAP